jgi:DNA polymerase-3 subunit delta
VVKANRIINYFCDNPKLNPPIATVAVLFSYFASLMQAHYAPDKSEDGLMGYLGLKNPYALKDYKMGMRRFNAMKTMKIISKLREADARLKGVEKGSMSDADVMKELLFFIMH